MFNWELPDGAARKLDMSDAPGLSMKRRVPLRLFAKPLEWEKRTQNCTLIKENNWKLMNACSVQTWSRLASIVYVGCEDNACSHNKIWWRDPLLNSRPVALIPSDNETIKGRGVRDISLHELQKLERCLDFVQQSTHTTSSSQEAEEGVTMPIEGSLDHATIHGALFPALPPAFPNRRFPTHQKCPRQRPEHAASSSSTSAIAVHRKSASNWRAPAPCSSLGRRPTARPTSWASPRTCPSSSRFNSSPVAAAAHMREHDQVCGTRPYFHTAEILSYGFHGLVVTPHGEHWRRVRRLCSEHVMSSARSHGYKAMRFRTW
ncbi:hypothetical protein EJB05_35610, partial [Eragrostis curvula]